jgi:hypothetical protein
MGAPPDWLIFTVAEKDELRAEIARLTAEVAALKATCAELVADGNAVTLAANLSRVSAENAALREDKARLFQTSEEYFADKDLFCRYVHNEVNPARLKEGLSVFNDSAINRLYDIAINGTHRAASQHGGSTL